MGKYLAVVGFLLINVLAKLIEDQCKALLPWLTKKLMVIAVIALPNEQRVRYREEWSSFLDEFPGDLLKLFAAFCLILAGIQIRCSLRLRAWSPKKAWDGAISGSLVFLFVTLLMARLWCRRILIAVGLMSSEQLIKGMEGEVFLLLVVYFLSKVRLVKTDAWQSDFAFFS